jgi:hypothetical protein
MGGETFLYNNDWSREKERALTTSAVILFNAPGVRRATGELASNSSNAGCHCRCFARIPEQSMRLTKLPDGRAAAGHQTMWRGVLHLERLWVRIHAVVQFSSVEYGWSKQRGTPLPPTEAPAVVSSSRHPK